MAGLIIWGIVVFGCAILFLSIGIYAEKREKPMWFWAGSTVDESAITDVKAYNKANARMWELYSLWYFASGIIYYWNEIIAIILLVLSCTVGIGILVATFNKIEKKYKVK
jgi:hypothetical protein